MAGDITGFNRMRRQQAEKAQARKEAEEKCQKATAKKMLQQLLGQEQKDWSRHIEEARAKGLAGPW